MTHAFTHAPTQVLTHAFTHAPTQVLTHAFTHAPTQVLTHAFTRALTHARPRARAQYYSALGSAMFAVEGDAYFRDWAHHVRREDGRPHEEGLMALRECGSLVLLSDASEAFLAAATGHMDTLGVPYERWDVAKVEARARAALGAFTLDSIGPTRRLDDPRFGERGSDGGRVRGGVFFPTSGYVSDPQLAARNLCDAALSTGMVQLSLGTEATAIELRGGRVAAVVTDGGERISTPVVLNAAGPHSSKVTRLAFGADGAPPDDATIRTWPSKREVAYIPQPRGGSIDEHGFIMMDLEGGYYVRPEPGGKVAIGTGEPACDDPRDALVRATWRGGCGALQGATRVRVEGGGARAFAPNHPRRPPHAGPRR